MTLYNEFLNEVGNAAQFEDRTCGLHALKSVYTFYGRETESRDLIERLGLEGPHAHTEQGEATGFLHTEILTVLTQDHFYYESLCLNQNVRKVTKKLLRHLAKGHMAMVLMRRIQNGRMHWVALRITGRQRLLVSDCLFAQPYTVSDQKIIMDCVCTCLVIRPLQKKDMLPADTLITGSLELLKAVNRYHELKLIREGSSCPFPPKIKTFTW